ncbi:hypothetical protein BELL_0151g00110 [Botrytis elliptica]|uniref:Uncharacterized protein n=1 Tax=Botrytis elliptica TaxID=278938 RepID=A0A4Z1JRU1_9HELO|nr:hypothetical protein EAE99_008978 [Botrytis elliptica]TGO76521.1 hypothetical protein BELL_0151g00110 [Botrytis elliptica]
MAARHTPVPSVESLSPTFSSTSSSVHSIDREESFRDCNHERVHGATPYSSSGSSVTLTGSASSTSSIVPSSSTRDKLQEIASLLPACDEPFFEQFSSIKNLWKVRLKQALEDAKFEKFIATKTIVHGMYHDELDLKTSFDKYASDMRNGNGDCEIPELDLGQRFHLADVFGHRFGFGACY